jgi:hypothetical protein
VAGLAAVPVLAVWSAELSVFRHHSIRFEVVVISNL